MAKDAILEADLGGIPISPDELAAIPDFSAIRKEIWSKFPGAITKKIYKPGEIIMREGESGTTAFYLLSGTVDIYINSPIASAKSKQGKSKSLFQGITKITSYRYPDERMYALSLDQALLSGKPVVLEFATPGHCTVCDTQLQMLKGLLEKYQAQVVFLHLDQYQNPQAFKAYTVIGDPWTFVIDNKQTVRYKQAGRMLYGELDAVIQGVLSSTQAPASAS